MRTLLATVTSLSLFSCSSAHHLADKEEVWVKVNSGTGGDQIFYCVANHQKGQPKANPGCFQAEMHKQAQKKGNPNDLFPND